jgi:hypothetical protein
MKLTADHRSRTVRVESSALNFSHLLAETKTIGVVGGLDRNFARKDHRTVVVGVAHSK